MPALTPLGSGVFAACAFGMGLSFFYMAVSFVSDDGDHFLAVVAASIGLVFTSVGLHLVGYPLFS